MKNIKHFILPEHTNTLYEKEAISSISLTRDIAKKTNELVDAYNELNKWQLETHQEQDGEIRKGILYMKDNLINTLHDLTELLKHEGFFDKTVAEYTVKLEKRLENLLGSISEGSTSMDAEVIDGRVAFDGEQFDNLGISIREQVARLHSILSENINFMMKRAGRTLITDWTPIVANMTLNQNGKPEAYNGYYLYDAFIKVDSLQEHFIFSPKYPISLYVHCFDRNKMHIGSVYTNVSKIPALHGGTHYIKPIFIANTNPGELNITLKEGSAAAKTTLHLYDTKIEPENCGFFISDIFIKEGLTKGVAIASDTGALVPFENRTYTDFINVENVKYITSNFPFYVSYYNEMFEWMSEIKDTDYHRAGTLKIPETACYVRLTLITEDDAVIDTFTLSNGEYPAQSEPYLNPAFQPQSAFNTWYEGKKVVAFGDSITELNQWQPFIKSYFGCEMINCGVGSSTVANNGLFKTVDGNQIESWMCSDDRINLIPEDCDVILIFGGANDSTSIPIGDIKTDMSDNTFLGAYSLMIKKLIAKFPNARLISLTPIGGRTDTESSNQDKQFYINELCMTDYASAVKLVSSYYGIPCIDVNGESGINVLNHTTYIGDIIHPNTEGGKRIANAVINGMKRFEPIDF